MIKIIKKQIEGVTEYSVEPKTTTLYHAGQYNKNVIEYKNCIFKTASHIIANDYWLEYENKGNSLYVRVDITTGKVKDDNKYFFDEAKAENIHKKQRSEYLKDRIEDRIKFLEEDRKELEELENFEKKGERK